ncbi:MAG: sugar transferase [Spirochaetales bacterium]|nr:sugar transferase [Spirochaetales bacterium]
MTDILNKKLDYLLKGMNMPSIKERIKLISQISQNNIGILDTAHFHYNLKIERARSDRNESQFALVLFELQNIKHKKILKKFIHHLYDRIRKVDIIGWFDKNIIGVILHGSSLRGAWHLAVDVSAEIFVSQAPPPFTVFIYPDHWIQKSDFDDQKDSKRGKPDENLTVMNLGTLLNDKNASSIDYGNNILQSSDQFKSIISKKMPLWKRTMDIVVSGFSILISLPLLLLVGIYIKIVSPGPVFFTQKRVGHKGKIFTLYKFRTMKVNNDENEHMNLMKNVIASGSKITKLDDKNDKRIIPGGNILRKTCIDELPQLLNIFFGHMSLVGPRPCIPYEAKEYLRWHQGRFDYVPGLTGLWQVSGKNDLTFKQMIRLDITYGRRMSPFFDLKIIFMTIPTILSLVFKSLKEKFAKKPKDELVIERRNSKELYQWVCDFTEAYDSVVD